MIDSYLSTLYKIEELLQTSVANGIDGDSNELEEALHLLSVMITDLEMNALLTDTELDDENDIPSEQ